MEVDGDRLHPRVVGVSGVVHVSFENLAAQEKSSLRFSEFYHSGDAASHKASTADREPGRFEEVGDALADLCSLRCRGGERV